jgi:hypothetical protein
MMASTLTASQRTLLRAVQAGHVAERHHLRCGWAARRTDARSSGPGGGLGRNVTTAIARLTRLGLVRRQDGVREFDDKPYQLTVLGVTALELADPASAAIERALAMPTLPVATDGRWPFPVGDHDAPDGAVLDLDDDDDTPGWWQRQGHQWVPVADQPSQAPSLTDRAYARPTANRDHP